MRERRPGHDPNRPELSGYAVCRLCGIPHKRHAYVTHLIEDGWDRFFVQQQVGHAWGSTTALYTGVSTDYKNTALRAALDKAFSTETRDS